MGSEHHGEKLSDMKAVVQSQAHINHMIVGCVKPMALKCAMDLGIPTAIHKHGGQPVTIPQLVHELSLSPNKAQPLAQLIRLLEHSGFFAKVTQENGAEPGYVLTPLSSCLLMDGASAFLQAVLHTSMVIPLIHLSSWFQGDEPTAFHTANGKGIWEFADENPKFNRLFNEAMAYGSRMVVKQIVGRFSEVFEGVESLVDVGGGSGAVARSIAEAFPKIKCTVYDLPHVVESLVSSERVEYVGGSMFERVPTADAVLLQRILHDYDDEKCLQILKQCKEAIISNIKKGKLIVVDMVINKFPEDNAYKSLETQLLSDVEMMAILGAKERDEQEFEKLFLEAGFKSYKITPLNHHFSLVECILHDHDDEKCSQILKQCKEAITSKGKKGKLIVVDIVINVTEGDAYKSLETQLNSDVHMMAVHGAKERNEQEFQKLFLEVGLTSYKITPFNNIYSLIVVYP